jgi:riboflavin kinase / FMN adenylyltransferase
LLPRTKQSALILGNFDGMHPGHQQLIDACLYQAKKNNLISVAVLFSTHPKCTLLDATQHPITLMSNPEKKAYLLQQGIDEVHFIPYNQTLRHLSPQKFIDQYLIHQFHCQHLCVGQDFHFGYQRQGTVTMLAKNTNFITHVVPDLLHHKTRVSSTQLRHYLAQYDFAQYAKICHRPFSITGTVVQGQQLATALGCPTANVLLNRTHFPLEGVFAAHIRNQQTNYQGLAYLAPLSQRQQVKNPWCEAHLFNFQAPLYHQKLTVTLLKKLRAFKKITVKNQLINQIQKDLNEAHNHFDQIPSS